MKDTVHPVDEVINKMKEVEGFGGFVICNNDGVVLRHENLGAADKLGIYLCGNQPVSRSRRWRGDADSSPLAGASAATSSPRNDLVKNCRVHPTHWLISTQMDA